MVKVRSITCMILCCFVVFFAVACSTNPIADSSSIEELESNSEVITSALEESSSLWEEMSGVDITEQIEVTLYASNDMAHGFVISKMYVEEMTEQVILDFLSSMGVFSTNVKINSMIKEDNLITLDFNEAFKEELLQCGTAGENAMIGSVVNTFIENYKVDSVMITSNGEIIETGHMIYDSPLKFVG